MLKQFQFLDQNQRTEFSNTRKQNMNGSWVTLEEPRLATHLSSRDSAEHPAFIGRKKGERNVLVS